MLSLNNGLMFDMIAWGLFGLLWLLFPIKLLTLNFGIKNYDWIIEHITRVFGLLSIYTTVPSYIAYNSTDTTIKKDTLFKKLIFELFLLMLMVTANSNTDDDYYHIKFGMTGVVICILINSVVLYNN